MSFWKNIFSKKQEKKADFIIAKVVSHINAERKDDYYHSDKEILKLFYDNKEIFAETILPMIDLCQAIGFSRQELRTAILNSIKFLTSNGVLEIFEKIMTENKIQRNKLFVKLQKNFTNPYKFDALLWDTAFDETLLDVFVLNQDEVDEIATEKKETYKEDMVYSAYHKHMLTVAIVKTFLYTRVVALIEKEAELTKILNNAYKKYHDCGEITEKTYDIFFDYIKIPKQYFTTIDYYRCIFQMYCTPYSLYSVEEIQLENNIHNSNFSKIIDDIITNKNYKGKDINILFKSALCEKMPYMDNVLTLLDCVELFDEFRKRVQKAVEKEDLLNNDYDYIEEKLTIADIDLMSGVEFECFLCSFFANQGYECSTTKASGDQGIDLIVKKDGVVIAIQAKCYTGTVGNHAVMEAFAGMKYYKANRCMVITNSAFSKSAIDLAQANGVILWDRQILIEKLNGIYEE